MICLACGRAHEPVCPFYPIVRKGIVASLGCETCGIDPKRRVKRPPSERVFKTHREDRLDELLPILTNPKG